MKASAIMERLTVILRSRLMMGWLVDEGMVSGSSVCWGVNLKKGSIEQELYIKRGAETVGGWGIDTLTIYSQYTAGNEQQTTTLETYYQIAENWYTQNVKEALATKRVRVERCRRIWGNERPKIIVTTTQAFMRRARRHRGFGRAKLEDVSIVRRPYYYFIRNTKNGHSYGFELPRKGGKQ